MEFLIKAIVKDNVAVTAEATNKCSKCNQVVNIGDEIYLEVSEGFAMTSETLIFNGNLYCKKCAGEN